MYIKMTKNNPTFEKYFKISKVPYRIIPANWTDEKNINFSLKSCMQGFQFGFFHTKW